MLTKSMKNILGILAVVGLFIMGRNKVSRQRNNKTVFEKPFMTQLVLRFEASF